MKPANEICLVYVISQKKKFYQNIPQTQLPKLFSGPFSVCRELSTTCTGKLNF